jgi:hypothetical protein
MYEHRKRALLSRRAFVRRVAVHLGAALVLVSFALGIGVLGYRFIARLRWIDAVLNASMILGGMGPVDTLTSKQAKLFASCYALFSGLAFVGIASLMLAPFAHRLLHKFHLAENEEAELAQRAN